MDTNIKPKVSILMPVYNGERFIKESLQSLLDQTLKDFELVVVNDGSTDKTEEIVKSFQDPRLRYVKNERNSGLVAVRNQALSLAQGDYVAWLDADDIALPRRLEMQVRFLDTHPDFALVGTWVEIINEPGKKTGICWKNRTKPEDTRAALFFGNQFTQSSVMLRRKELPSLTYRSEYAPAEDYDLWIRLAEHKKLGTIPKILTRYRTLPKSAAHGSENQNIAREKILTDNLARIGITPKEEERTLHQTNFAYTGNDTSFLKKREAWLLKLIEINRQKKVFDEKSFEKIAAERWLASCRANTQGFKTWRLCWDSPLAKYISWSERWRDICWLAARVLV